MTVDRRNQLYALLQADLDALPDLPQTDIDEEETPTADVDSTANLDWRFIWVTQPPSENVPKLQGESRFVWVTDPNKDSKGHASSNKTRATEANVKAERTNSGQTFKHPPSQNRFCPILPVSKFPYKFIRGEASQQIAERFFDEGKFWKREWKL